MTPADRARQIWQSEQGTQAMPSIEELRSKSEKFHRKIKLRNRIEYVAGFFAFLWFGWIAVMGPLPWTPPEIPANIVRLGSGLLVCGIMVAMWQLHKRTNPLLPPEDRGIHSALQFQRKELVRQRDAISYYFFWYILPFVPGFVVLMLVPLALSPTIGEPAWFAVLAKVSLIPLILAAIMWLSRHALHKMQLEIDKIDQLMAE